MNRNSHQQKRGGASTWKIVLISTIAVAMVVLLYLSNHVSNQMQSGASQIHNENGATHKAGSLLQQLNELNTDLLGEVQNVINAASHVGDTTNDKVAEVKSNGVATKSSISNSK